LKARVFATPEAEQQILDVSAWWHAKRPSVEGQFDRELSDTLNLLGEAPDVGRRYRRRVYPASVEYC
jgi:plasmid stabilization system protein ParE